MGTFFGMRQQFGYRELARDRTVPTLLGIAAFVLIFMHSWWTLLIAGALAVIGFWLTIRANRKRGWTLSHPIGRNTNA